MNNITQCQYYTRKKNMDTFNNFVRHRFLQPTFSFNMEASKESNGNRLRAISVVIYFLCAISVAIYFLCAISVVIYFWSEATSCSWLLQSHCNTEYNDTHLCTRYLCVYFINITRIEFIQCVTLNQYTSILSICTTTWKCIAANTMHTFYCTNRTHGTNCG